jgi:hypothetical protein
MRHNARSQTRIAGLAQANQQQIARDDEHGTPRASKSEGKEDAGRQSSVSRRNGYPEKHCRSNRQQQADRASEQRQQEHCAHLCQPPAY